jgi:hypothetical protein
MDSNDAVLQQYRRYTNYALIVKILNFNLAATKTKKEIHRIYIYFGYIHDFVGSIGYFRTYNKRQPII